VDLNPLKKKFTRSQVRNMRIDFRTLFLIWYKIPDWFVFCTAISVRPCGNCESSHRSFGEWRRQIPGPDSRSCSNVGSNRQIARNPAKSKTPLWSNSYFGICGFRLSHLWGSWRLARRNLDTHERVTICEDTEVKQPSLHPVWWINAKRATEPHVGRHPLMMQRGNHGPAPTLVSTWESGSGDRYRD